ncbi:uncharacterized protein LOC132611810 [Lycium barbarum]|uniref:uncharacterized protein LOC132611810 n=1 Tax=Lycium barbarum TaxID=112863 RepID=UPI00293F3510|nr:uncharacterized protein LOC132611810 [Lycium barbarum]
METERDVNAPNGTATVGATVGTTIGGTVGPTNVASSSHPTIAHAMAPTEKPGKFSSINFKGWQQRMFFWLTTLGMQKFTNENPSVTKEGMHENQRFMITEAWKHADFLCKGYILSALDDDLYNVYSSAKTSKELWLALEKKYKTEDACLKQFVVAKFLDYKMTDSMVINEVFQVAVVIEKLPPSWRDFKNYLKHKRKEMSLEDLVIRLNIEEDNKVAEKKSRGNSTIIGANIVKEATLKNKKRKKPCGKRQANMVEKNDDMDDLCAMLSECNLVGNPKEWRLDSGATRHVCAVKEAFATYALAGPEEELFVGNTATTKVEGYGKILLKMTSGYSSKTGLSACWLVKKL